jgi:hypothetical protein
MKNVTKLGPTSGRCTIQWHRLLLSLIQQLMQLVMLISTVSAERYPNTLLSLYGTLIVRATLAYI